MQTLKRKTTAPLVISYLRFSQIGQAKGDSTRRQSEGAEKWCKEHGRTLTDKVDDRGISALRGANRYSGKLSAFLELVRLGTVPEGSTLIVEDLDRLSRQVPEEALELFLSIIRAGVTVVTLIDGNEYRKGELDMQKLMVSVMRICLAHEESAKKSMRLAKAWKQKRSKISEGQVYTSLLPSWLQAVKGKVTVNEAQAEIIRQMFQLVIEGYGTVLIAKKLDQHRSYVSKCLHNPQVLGEFQPYQLTYSAEGKKSRKPIGDVIRGYYPAIVDEESYYAVQRLMQSRKRDCGPSQNFVNLFKGLMFNQDDQSAMVVVNKGGTGRQYVSSKAAMHQKGAADYIAVPIDHIEKELIKGLCIARDIEPSVAEPLHLELAATEGRFAELSSQIAKLAATLSSVGNVVAVVEVIAKLEAEKKQLGDRRREIQEQIDALNSNDGEFEKFVAEKYQVKDIEGRTQLRAKIRRHVKRIEISVTKKGHMRSASWSITFVEGIVLMGATTFHVRDPEAVEAQQKAREMWKQAMRPKLISEATGMSVSQVYRVCVGIKREGKWEPASRWDAKPESERGR